MIESNFQHGITYHTHFTLEMLNHVQRGIIYKVHFKPNTAAAAFTDISFLWLTADLLFFSFTAISGKWVKKLLAQNLFFLPLYNLFYLLAVI